MTDRTTAPRTSEDLLRRIEQLERDNDRLREKIEPILGPDNPCFHPKIFLKVQQRAIALAMIPLWLGIVSMVLLRYLTPSLTTLSIGEIPLFSFADGKVQGMGMGIISLGGVACGAIAIGGFSIGLIAFGGCAVGLVAVGGGAVGVIAVGGGAFGFVAVGGGATGYYAMGRTAHGKYRIGLNHQDQEAIDFFVRYVPGLRRAFTNPMPVIPLEASAQGHSGSSPVT